MERVSGENRRYSPPPPPPPQSNSPLNRLQCEVAAAASTREDGEETEKEDEVPPLLFVRFTGQQKAFPPLDRRRE